MDPEILQTLLKNSKATIIGNTMLVLILYGLQILLDKHIPCPCTGHEQNFNFAWLFFCVPSAILLLIRLLLQLGSHQWHCNEDCRTCWKFILIYSKLVFQLFLPSMIWIFVLLLDGDYYACSVIMENGTVSGQTCAHFSCQQPLHQECDHSRYVGSICIFVFLVVLLITHCLSYCLCCNTENYYYKYQCDTMCKEQQEELIMEAVERTADEKAKRLFNKMQNKLRSLLVSASEEHLLRDDTNDEEHHFITVCKYICKGHTATSSSLRCKMRLGPFSRGDEGTGNKRWSNQRRPRLSRENQS
ncbi:calcium homeostasis modulator protein 5-like [Hemiscyllium ocellatum]|uniref:calcium homeostasis modulator protein 5-like n=1 Tax=Hemiscyllium ocellatum TaxID=170820 RepID=UPI0029674456|nr:calcium homeostasis modulator protein 5-like [Hemiscyllium ocellatum]